MSCFENVKRLEMELVIQAVQKYLEFTEAQMEEVHRYERVVIEENVLYPTTSAQLWTKRYPRQGILRRSIPADAYSFVFLVKFGFENRLQKFCDGVAHVKRIPISLKDIAGVVPS